MKRICCSLVVAMALSGSAVTVSYRSNVVGYSMQRICHGMNRVEISFTHIGQLFPTMAGVLEISEPEKLIGDELHFVLDGRHQSFVFKEYDGSDYVLVAARKGSSPPRTSLDAIPLLPVVWIRHNSTNVVAVTLSGEVDLNEDRQVYGEYSARAKSTSAGTLRIFIVGDDDVSGVVGVELKGGKIRRVRSCGLK